MIETTMKEVGAGVEAVLPEVAEVGQLEAEVAAQLVDSGADEVVDRGVLEIRGISTLVW